MPYYKGVRGGESYMDFSKWQPEILHEIEYLVFHNYFVFFFFFFFEIHIFRSDQFSLLLYRSLTSVVCYCQNGLWRKHLKCSLCNEWWHSFMNQRLHHLVLLYTFNSIRIMFLNTYNKNVDIIWHYCIMKCRDCLGRDILGTNFF